MLCPSRCLQHMLMPQQLHRQHPPALQGPLSCQGILQQATTQRSVQLGQRQ
jgi:hypothetical protein